MPWAAAPTEMAAAPLTPTRQRFSLPFAQGGHLAKSTPANWARKEGCPELDMYTVDFRARRAGRRRMTRPGSTPRAGSTSLAVPEQGRRGGQRSAETGKPGRGHAPFLFLRSSQQQQQQQKIGA